MTIAKALLLIKQIKLVKKNKFAATSLNSENKIFLVYVRFFANSNSDNPLYYGAWLTFFLANKVCIAIFSQYIDFIVVFFLEYITTIAKYTKINDYWIILVGDSQQPYRPFHSLGSVKLKMFKIYIEINLVNGFMKFFKSSSNTFILFIQKANDNFWLCINY